MKKVKKIFIVLLILTLYCNIGWVVGNYYVNHVVYTPQEDFSTLGKIAAGGWSFVNVPSAMKEAVIIFYGVFWPLSLACIIVSWIVYGCYYVSWFIFAGGGAKLLGLA